MTEVESLKTLFNIQKGQAKKNSDKTKDSIKSTISSTLNLKDSSKSLNSSAKTNNSKLDNISKSLSFGRNVSLVDPDFLFEIQNKKFFSQKFHADFQNQSFSSTFQTEILNQQKSELFKSLRPASQSNLNSKEGSSLETNNSYLNSNLVGTKYRASEIENINIYKNSDSSLSLKESNEHFPSETVDNNILQKKSENSSHTLHSFDLKTKNFSKQTTPCPDSNSKHDLELLWSGFVLPLVIGFVYLYIRFFHPYIPHFMIVLPAISLVTYFLYIYFPLNFKSFKIGTILKGFTAAPQTQLYTIDQEKCTEGLSNKVDDQNSFSTQEQKILFDKNQPCLNSSSLSHGSKPVFDSYIEKESKIDLKDTENFLPQSTGTSQKTYQEAANIKVNNFTINHPTFKFDNSDNRSYKTAAIHPASSFIKSLGDIKKYLYYTPKESIDLLELDQDVSKIDIKARIWISRKIIIPLFHEIEAVDKDLISKGLFHLMCEQPGQNRSLLTPNAPAVSSASTFSSSGKTASQPSLTTSIIFDQTLSKSSASSTAPAIGLGSTTNSTFSKPTLLGGNSLFSNSGSFGSTITPLGTGLKANNSQTDLPYDLVDLYQWLGTFPKESPKHNLALRRLKIERFLSICNSVYSRRALINRIKAFSESTLLQEFSGDYGKMNLPLDENIEASTSASKVKLAPGLDFTDTQLLLHLIFTYFDLSQKKYRIDTQLDNFAFSSKRWVPYGSTSDHLDGPYIKQLSPGASHLVVVNPNYSIIYDVVRGDSNLFVTLITFATLVKKTAPEEHPLAKMDWVDLLGQD